MRSLTVLLTCAVALWSADVRAQAGPGAPPPPSSPPGQPATTVESARLFAPGSSEWSVTGGPAWSVVLFNSASGHRYALMTAAWGRIFTGPIGPGILRGRFQWSFEVVPVFGQFAPNDTYGFGLTPLAWRWNFEPTGRYAPYAELGGGGLWTRDPVPERTTTANFTAHAGLGMRIFVGARDALTLGYRFHHISNGNRLERNPGVNAHVVQFGWSYFRPRR